MTIPELEKDIEAIWGSPGRAQAIALLVSILKDHETEIEKLNRRVLEGFKPDPPRAARPILERAMTALRRPVPYLYYPDGSRHNVHGLPNLPVGYRLLRFGEKIDDRCYYCCQGDEDWTKCDNWIWPKENLFYCTPDFTP